MPVLKVHTGHSKSYMQAFSMWAERLDKGGQGAQALSQRPSGFRQKFLCERASSHRGEVLMIIRIGLIERAGHKRESLPSYTAHLETPPGSQWVSQAVGDSRRAA